MSFDDAINAHNKRMTEINEKHEARMREIERCHRRWQYKFWGCVAAIVVVVALTIIYVSERIKRDDRRRRLGCEASGGLVLPESEGWRCALPGERR